VAGCLLPLVNVARLSCVSRALAVIPSFYVASGSRPVVIVLVLAVEGYFLRANGGCQTPCLVISACAVAETALASTPPLSLLR